jgi:sugar phosphate isomerase/epimerase
MNITELLGIGAAPSHPFFILCGFADEAADSIEGQIEVTKALGWKWIEARSIDGQNIHDLSDKEFAQVANKLESAHIRISCFGSTIANWGKNVIDEDFAQTMQTVRRAVRRMQFLDVKLVRIMSYAIITDSRGNPLPDQRVETRLAHLGAICSEFLEHGITPVHENCFNYGGMSIAHTRQILDAIPGLKLVFDTGNPSLTPDFSKPKPWPNQDTWQSWQALKANVAHLHIKDGWRDAESGKETYVFPGEGPSRVADILSDCIQSAYGGFLSIEPHMAVVFHDARIHSDDEQRKAVYIEYGKRIEAMLRNLGLAVENGEACFS